MKKIEYLKVHLFELKDDYNQMDIAQLNTLGQNGWELITVIGGEAIFKRKK